MKPLAAAFSCQPLLAVVKVDRFNQRLPTRCGRVPNRETPRRRSASGSSTATATACRRTTPKQRAGSDWAADQGVAEAQYTLGGIYREGHGVPQDYAEAVRWYRLAADQGYGEGQSDLGAMYFQGRGVVQDYVQSHMWRNLAALRQTGQDHELSVNARDALASLMTPAQVAEAQRLAREWDAAHPGSAVPFISQGLMRGGDVIEWINDGVEVTPVEEVTPEEIAELRERGEVAELLALAEQGNAFAQDNLGDMYAKPEKLFAQLPVDGVPEDDVEAARWYRLAAEQGTPVRSSTSGSCTPPATASRRTTSNHCAWFAWRRSRGTGRRITASGSCTATAAASQRTTRKRICGSTSRRLDQPVEIGSVRSIVATLMAHDQIAEALRLARAWDAAHPREP